MVAGEETIGRRIARSARICAIKNTGAVGVDIE